MNILLCVALHLYSGPTVTEAQKSCKKTTIAAARKAIAKCASQGAETCEVALSSDRKTIVIENKLRVK